MTKILYNTCTLCIYNSYVNLENDYKQDLILYKLPIQCTQQSISGIKNSKGFF